MEDLHYEPGAVKSCLTPTSYKNNTDNNTTHIHTESPRTFNLVCDLDKEAEAFRRLEEQPLGDVLAELLGLGAGVHLEGLQVQHRTGLAGDFTHRKYCLVLCTSSVSSGK